MTEPSTRPLATDTLATMTRRTMVGATAAGIVAALASQPAHAAAPGTDGASALEAAFNAAFSAATNDPAAVIGARLALLRDDARIIDHDVPFSMDREAYADHLAFRSESFERYELVLHQIKVEVHGPVGVANGYMIERGKPRSAGFRLRSGFVTAVCLNGPDGWEALSLHISAMIGQIADASPA